MPDLGLIDEYELLVQPVLAGHGPTLLAGLRERIQLELVDRYEFRSGAVATRYRPTRVRLDAIRPGILADPARRNDGSGSGCPALAVPPNARTCFAVGFVELTQSRQCSADTPSEKQSPHGRSNCAPKRIVP